MANIKSKTDRMRKRQSLGLCVSTVLRPDVASHGNLGTKIPAEHNSRRRVSSWAYGEGENFFCLGIS
jgi:hypothetical protein